MHVGYFLVLERFEGAYKTCLGLVFDGGGVYRVFKSLFECQRRFVVHILLVLIVVVVLLLMKPKKNPRLSARLSGVRVSGSTEKYLFVSCYMCMCCGTMSRNTPISQSIIYCFRPYCFGYFSCCLIDQRCVILWVVNVVCVLSGKTSAVLTFFFSA